MLWALVQILHFYCYLASLEEYSLASLRFQLAFGKSSLAHAGGSWVPCWEPNLSCSSDVEDNTRALPLFSTFLI